jgi:hypothetical protein
MGKSERAFHDNKWRIECKEEEEEEEEEGFYFKEFIPGHQGAQQGQCCQLPQT